MIPTFYLVWNCTSLICWAIQRHHDSPHRVFLAWEEQTGGNRTGAGIPQWAPGPGMHEPTCRGDKTSAVLLHCVLTTLCSLGVCFLDSSVYDLIWRVTGIFLYSGYNINSTASLFLVQFQVSVVFPECLFVSCVGFFSPWSVPRSVTRPRMTPEPGESRKLQRQRKAQKANCNLQFHLCVSTKNTNQERDASNFFSWRYCNPQ